jgi:hypothetical protein
MNTNRWLDPSQPPRLQQGTQMLYFTAAFDVLNGAISGWFVFFLLAAVKVAGGYGIANEKKWGYNLAVAAAIVNVLLLFRIYGVHTLTNLSALISLGFDAALVALLLHPMSRDYQRIWFR